jgi:hypothetical protein
MTRITRMLRIRWGREAVLDAFSEPEDRAEINQTKTMMLARDGIAGLDIYQFSCSNETD